MLGLAARYQNIRLKKHAFSLLVYKMSSTYGWLTESSLAIERPVALRGISQQTQILLASIVRKQQESQQRQLVEQRPLFLAAAKEGKVFTHSAECDRRWTRPTTKPLDWAERQLAARNVGVALRNAADEAEESRYMHDPSSVEAHLENKSKLYDRIVSGATQTASASLLLQLRQKRRTVQKSQRLLSASDLRSELSDPQLSTDALTELINLPDRPDNTNPADEMQVAHNRAARLAFLQARLNLYRHVLKRDPAVNLEC